MSLSASANSYPPTMVLFIAHWNGVNAKRPAPLVLKDGETVQTLSDLRAAIEAAISSVNTGVQSTKIVSLDRKTERAALRNRMMQFRKAADYWLEGKNYARDIKPLPAVSSLDAAYLDVSDSMIFAWNLADEEPVVAGGLKLEGDYSLADFRSDVDAIRAQPLTTATAVLSTSDTRDDRNDLLLPARTLLKKYGKAIRALYSATSDEVKTLPQLWEKNEPNPEAPKLKVDYVAGASTAKATWNQIVDPAIVRVFVSIAPGVRYAEKNARRLASLTPDVMTYDLPDGTITPGSNNWIKVIVVDEDGDEIGSNAVKIERTV